MSLCRDRTLVKHAPNAQHLYVLKCRCWSCDRCAPDRRSDLRWLARRGHPTAFLTLTIRKGRFATPDAQAHALSEGWRMLRQFLCRTYGLKSIPFLAIVEKHRSGWPHLHILVRGPYLDHKVIRGWWKARFASPIIDIRKVKDERQLAIYVSKYIAKDPTRFEGCKRYWRSQDFELERRRKASDDEDPFVSWSVEMDRPTLVATLAILGGKRVSFADDHWIIHGPASFLEAERR